MMWRRLSAGSCLEGNAPVPLNIRAQTRVLDRLRQDFDGTTESLANPTLQRDQADQIHLCRWVKLRDEVDVAVFHGIATCDRTKERQMAHARFTQLRLMDPQCGDDMVGQVGAHRFHGIDTLARKYPARSIP